MRQIILIAQVIISLLLIVSVLLQQRGGGLSQVFGGTGGAYRTRRGVERVTLWATIILAILFLIAALLSIRLR
ncbi:MAG: preprotein translocase subunit SecG [bacterium]|nr:preprotein translocase subunit SecG [bacterium]MDZ4299911.1 preprotein translocase subunit SecG [Candidatus Sungbacteria bacterium]